MQNQQISPSIKPKRPNTIKSGFIFGWISLGALFPVGMVWISSDLDSYSFVSAAAVGVIIILAIVMAFLRRRQWNLKRFPKLVMAIIFIIVGFFVTISMGIAIDNTFDYVSDTRINKPLPSSLGGPGDGGIALKPVIYLYPPETTDVAVNVQPTSGISYSEPQITSTGWEVTAYPDGTLIDTNNITWPYLFWEGNPWNLPIPQTGFVIPQAEVSSFFDEKLSFLGLNEIEIKDFKEYWVPVMQDKPYYFITFIDQLTFNEYAPLTITPTPDTIIRVYFHHEGLDKPIKVTPQLLTPAPNRTGFTVIEWGGQGAF